MTLPRIVLTGFLLQLALASFVSAQVIDPGNTAPVISFLTDAVEVSNLAPGGKVVWFGATQVIAADDVPEIRAYASIAEDSDSDGVERLDFPDGVPLHSTWVVVDLTSGYSAAAAPDGYPLQIVDWKGQGIQSQESGDDLISDGRQTGNLLVARPDAKGGGGSAWMLESGDGGPADTGLVADGAMSLTLSSLEPLGETADPAPSHFQPGDVVVMLDPRLLELTLVTVE